jgi:hypothetical protein
MQIMQGWDEIYIHYILLWGPLMVAPTAGMNLYKDSQCTYDVTMGRARAIIAAEKKQWVLRILIVCVCV